MFTLKTLLGRVFVQLLTYEDESACISLTWPPPLHTNVQLKTRSRTRVRAFLTKSYLYASLVTWDSCLYHVLSHYFDWSECLYNFWHTSRRFWTIVCLSPTCLHASSSTKRSVYA